MNLSYLHSNVGVVYPKPLNGCTPYSITIELTTLSTIL